MANAIASFIVVTCFILISLPANSNQNVRQKRQISSDQPRIVTENGHLVFKAARNRNISFLSGAGSSIFIDSMDLKDTTTQLSNQVKANKDRLDGFNTSVTSYVTSRIVELESRLMGNIDSIEASVGQLPQQVSTVSASFNGFRTQQQQSMNALSMRVTNLESRPSGSGGSGSGNWASSASLEVLTSRVQTLERQLSALTTRVNNLFTLLTTNECLSNPCHNGGTCVDMYNGYICRCPSNFKGAMCTQDVNECAEYAGTSLGCQNGATCLNTHGGFRCQCTTNWHGIHCSEQHDDCTGASQSELCGHGTCINVERQQPGQPKYRCVCESGWTNSGSNPACDVDIDECQSGRHCSTNPAVSCMNTPGSFMCGPCPQGFEGNGFSCTDVNECLSYNGGCSTSPRVDCINTFGSRACGRCPLGYQGDGVTCTFTGQCQVNNGGCHPQATCTDDQTRGPVCVCPSGYVGSGRGPNGCVLQSTAGACGSAPCLNGARCVPLGTTNFRCQCQAGYTGTTCATQIDPCDSNPCANGGTCTSNGPSFSCACTDSYSGDRCQERQESCGSYLTGETGSFRFPRATGTNYPHESSCAWVITTSNNKILRLTFPSFSLESSPTCSYDFLQIHDGPSASSYLIGKYCGTTPPNGGSINSTHNQIYLWFYSDSSVSSDGFEVQWTSLMPECGGTLIGSNHGTINSPGYPGNYPHNRDCVWVVAVSPGSSILFQFAHLAIEQHSNCSYDYLRIRDGELSSSPVLQQYCTSQTPAPLRTTGPFAYVRFHTDASISDRGFHITYAALNTSRAGCGGQLTGDEGQFTSPGYPNPYDHNSQCVWVITATAGNQVQLTFSSFDLETDSTCDFDYVQVRDGGDETSPNLGTFCGSDIPSVITSTSNVLFVKFKSDESITGSGFQAQWTTGCGGLFTGNSGQIQSPSYPQAYPHNKLCQYVIQVSEGSRVRLTFQDFSLEGPSGGDCSFDFVTIYDGSTQGSDQLGSAYCGTNRPEVVRSTGNTMMVTFRTDGSISNTGFRATYVAEEADECGGVITDDTGIIQSPGFPNFYTHGIDCEWFITVNPGYVIRFDFHTINLEGRGSNCFDYVEVFDNTTAYAGSSRGRYCGTSIPRSIITSDNSMVVLFHTDQSIARQGFSASFISLNVSSVCGATLTAASGVITSPNYPNNYPHGRSCEWIIQAPNRNQVSINITNFNLERSSTCAYDYLEFRNGGSPSSPLLGRYCGTTFPGNTFLSHGRQIYIKFLTDGSISRSGFRLEYDTATSGCGGDLTGQTGGISSPNYPESYNHNAECFWTVTVSRGSSVFFIFQDFDIETHVRCIYDYLEVREGGPQGSQIGNRLCGRQIPLPFTSRTNRIWIKMKTDYSVTGRGFLARYISSCNNRLTARTGVIESPNFPNAYDHRTNCSWVIEAPLGNKVNISFAAFHLESHRNCRFDRLEFRDGNATDAPVIKSLCGPSLPEPFQSSGRFLRINFITDYSRSYEGFRLEYVAAGCGGDLRGDTGVIRSPNYPNSYPHRTECLWTITVGTGKSVVLNISDFDMESHSACNYDVLEVYAGSDRSGPRLSQLCHTQTSPQIITSTGNTMTLRFSTDASVTGRGFLASYATADGGCGGNFSARSGTIMSKNYPNNYPHNTECEWLISVTPFHVVQLNFTAFRVEGGSCRFDYVKLYDGPSTSSNLLATLCGSSLSQRVYSSSSNQMFVRMRTDSSVSFTGFSADYRTACGGRLNANNASEIMSPNYPENYPRQSRCVWVIQADSNDQRVTLTFTSMDVGNGDCQAGSYVTVADGIDAVDNTTNRYCGNSIPPSITSFGSALTVVFQAGNFRRTGFRATYTSAVSACGGNFTSDSGRFTTPGYPDNYPVNTECVWQIQVSPGNAIQLSFLTFQLDPNGGLNDDYVEVRTPDVRGQLVGRYIGQSPPANITTLHGAWIKFRSNEAYPALGFMAEWSTVYGGTIESNSGQLASPQYPRFYPNNVEYTWTIIVDTDKVMRVTFPFFELERCPYDDMQLTDGTIESGSSLGTFCGALNPGQLYTTTNVLTVRFRSDPSVSMRGFLMEWTAVYAESTGVTTVSPAGYGCGGDLVAMDDWYSFTSPDNLTGYGNNLDCRWRITAPEGSSVIANITYINLEGGNGCPFDYVVFYSGVYPSRFTQIGPKYCSRTRNAELIQSSESAMIIDFHTDGSVAYEGFQVAIKIGCGSTFRSQTGQIMSPSFPNNYPDNSNCTWMVRVRTGKTVLLTFNRQFNIATTGVGCPNDYLLLLNGNGVDAPPLYQNGTTANTNGRYCGTTAPQDIETTGTFLTASFISDGSSSASGFSMNFTEKSLACGGRIVLSHRMRSSYISSPNYPANYPQNVDCIWIIIAPSTERLQLDYDTIEIESHSRCQYDFVQIRDGGTQYSQPLGPPSCGTTVPSSQVSTGNMMRVRFVTDGSITRKGFRASVSLATCGGRISGSSGQISSPNYPSTYPTNTQCDWVIAAPTGHYIQINITSFNLQSSTNCTADSLEIFDGNSTSPSLSRRCGYSSRYTVETSDSSATIRFLSDASTANTGFTLSFAASIEVCGGELTASSGTFTSPSYPRRYAHARRCIWYIRVAQGRRVTLNFDDFELERGTGTRCPWDYIEIRNGGLPLSPFSGRYCGSTMPPTIESSGNSMTVTFATDGSVSHRGFRASYTSDNEAACGGILTADSGNITSGAYNNSLECIWLIETRTSGPASILLQFTQMHIEFHTRCGYDRVEIREGSSPTSPLVGRYCGNTTNRAPIVLPSNQALIMFRTDISIIGDGFSLLYRVSACGGVLTGSSGTISSPNYPSNYDHNDGCVWLIRVAEGSQIRLTITDFDLENHTNCQYDYLRIQNGGLFDSPVIGTYCGNTGPPTIVSQANEMRVMMVTDYSESARGFQLTYTTRSEGCGGMYHQNEGNMSSPNYPSSYPHNTECSWDVNVASGYRVKLTFVPPFDLEITTPCNNDYVEVFDYYPNGTAVSLGRYCSNLTPGPLLSSSTRLGVTFHSNGMVNGNGFAAYWELQCGGLYTQDTGILHSPNHPGNYPNNVICNYTIQPEGHKHIYLSFNAFEIEGARSCQHDSLTIRSDNSHPDEYLARVCGSTQPEGLTSVGTMYLQFITDSSITLPGFQASYYAEECGGTFTGANGIIRSPLFPNNYHNYANCSWSITVASDRVIALKFSSFELEQHPACSFDAVIIYDGPDESSNRIGSFCGGLSTVPEVIRTSGNQMFIRFITDGSFSQTGFHGGYMATYGPAQGCGGVIRQIPSTISSLDIDNDGNYENGLDCEWVIFADGNKVATLTFNSMNVENDANCRYDYIKVYDGQTRQDTVLGMFCGTTVPAAIISSSNVLLVVFHTDYSVVGTGFTATVGQADRVCGGSFNATSTPATISSPNYPNSYSTAVRCSWVIDSGNSYDIVKVQVTDLSLTDQQECQNEYLSLADMTSPQQGRESHYCGRQIPQPFYSIGQRVLITYALTGNSNSRGFRLNYTIADCNRNYTGSGGAVSSPNYPQSYPHNRDCSMNITAPAGTTLALYFYDFNLESHSLCVFDYLQVRNSSGFEVAKVCGSILPAPVFLPDNRAMLKFRSDYSISREGFMLTFIASTQGSGCGGEISDISRGSLTSPSYPGNSSVAQTCDWVIRPPRRTQLRLFFSYISMADPSFCASNYVALYEGATSIGNESVRFCTEGLRESNALVISNPMLVRYVNTGTGTAPIFHIKFTSQSST